MAIQPIKISEFRSIHKLSERAFSQVRRFAQESFPLVKLTELHHEQRHNHNVVLRPDILQEFLPGMVARKKPPSSKPPSKKLDIQNLYFRIEELEKEAARQKEELTARSAVQSEILVGKA